MQILVNVQVYMVIYMCEYVFVKNVCVDLCVQSMCICVCVRNARVDLCLCMCSCIRYVCLCLCLYVFYINIDKSFHPGRAIFNKYDSNLVIVNNFIEMAQIASCKKVISIMEMEDLK